MSDPVPKLQVGLGLWSMRSTVYEPAPWGRLYRELREDAVLAEELGYDGLWLAEHHFWYDGWCPQPTVAAAAALAATTTLRIGTAMLLLPQHDVTTVLRDLRTLRDMHGDRIDLGVGLGYRDDEYDGVGVPRPMRGRRMSSHLAAVFAEGRAGGAGRPAVYVGGVAEAAVRRAGRYGAGLLLPNSLSAEEIDHRRRMCVEEAESAGLEPGRTGMLVDVWVTEEDSESSRRQALEHLVVSYREYAGAWYRLRGEPAFRRPDLLDKQSARTRNSAIVGTADEVADGLLKLCAAGVDTLVLQVRTDYPPPAYRRVVRALSNEVLPVLRGAL
jgi:alkanesulfonate monooxygenase SsuD/methylene tetrahydromethanopterin reductase-like flavin-dependent oxidoreductase (luciferase family)